MKIHTIVTCVGLFLVLGPTYGAPVNVTTGHVDISFDDEASYFAEVGSYNNGTFFQTSTTPGYVGLGDALVLSPGLYNPVGGSGYADGGFINFSVFDFSFAAHAGYQITGYRISFSGVAEQVGAGSYGINATNGGISFAGSNYTFASEISSDLMNSGFSGSITLDAPYVEGPDGTADVYGTAYASIDTITIEAITQPVPEPESHALMLAGLAAIGFTLRRRGC